MQGITEAEKQMLYLRDVPAGAVAAFFAGFFPDVSRRAGTIPVYFRDEEGSGPYGARVEIKPYAVWGSIDQLRLEQGFIKFVRIEDLEAIYFWQRRKKGNRQLNFFSSSNGTFLLQLYPSGRQGKYKQAIEQLFAPLDQWSLD